MQEMLSLRTAFGDCHPGGVSVCGQAIAATSAAISDRLRFVSAVELVHEEPGETDPGDTELGQARERRTAHPNDVHWAVDTPDELADQLVVREPYWEHAIGPGLKVESRAAHSFLEQLAATAFVAQHVDPCVQDDIDAGLGRRVTGAV
jgi:hypothetical protein